MSPCAWQPTKGPMWGYPRLVLGALGSFLEPFCGNVLPKVDKLCSKLTFEIPPRRALRGSRFASPPACRVPPLPPSRAGGGIEGGGQGGRGWGWDLNGTSKSSCSLVTVYMSWSSVCVELIHTCTHTHMHTYTHAHMHTYARTRTQARARTHTHAQIELLLGHRVHVLVQRLRCESDPLVTP